MRSVNQGLNLSEVEVAKRHLEDAGAVMEVGPRTVVLYILGTNIQALMLFNDDPGVCVCGRIRTRPGWCRWRRVSASLGHRVTPERNRLPRAMLSRIHGRVAGVELCGAAGSTEHPRERAL